MTHYNVINPHHNTFKQRNNDYKKTPQEMYV
jgi:hypothetical protein